MLVHDDLDGVNVIEIRFALDATYQIHTSQLRIISKGCDRHINHFWTCHRFITLDHDNEIRFNPSNRFCYPVAGTFMSVGSHDHIGTKTLSRLTDFLIAGGNIGGIKRTAHGDALIDMLNHSAPQ